MAEFSFFTQMFDWALLAMFVSLLVAIYQLISPPGSNTTGQIDSRADFSRNSSRASRGRTRQAGANDNPRAATVAREESEQQYRELVLVINHLSQASRDMQNMKNTTRGATRDQYSQRIDAITALLVECKDLQSELAVHAGNILKASQQAGIENTEEISKVVKSIRQSKLVEKSLGKIIGMLRASKDAFATDKPTAASKLGEAITSTNATVAELAKLSEVVKRIQQIESRNAAAAA